MNRIYILILFFFLVLHKTTEAQEVISANINDIIESAQSDSPGFLLAKTRQNNAYWIYVGAKSIFKPQLNLSATLPSIDRSISAYTLPDGTRTFVNSSFMSNSVGVSLNQIISATGGSVTLGTDLQRLDDFGSSGSAATYLSTPISIRFDQPLFRLNPYKWDKKEAEINYEASKKRYVEDRERIAFDAVNNFFDLYISKINLEESIRNSAYLDSLAVNAEGRFSVGRISETELLQIQLSAKNAKGTVARNQLDVQNKIESLRDFLGIQTQVDFDLETPEPLTLFDINKEKALEYALKNRSITEDFRLRLLAAQRQMETAEKNNGPSLQLRGSFGLTQSAESVGVPNQIWS